MKKIHLIAIVLGIIIFATSCNNNKPIPRPKGYFRIQTSAREYKKYNDDCPFKFELPVNAFLIKGEQGNCWMDIYYPENKATIYLTYKPVNGDLNKHFEDSREFVYKHVVKADAIEETRWENDSLRVYGMLFDLKGNTASSLQFFLTDSTDNFIRGSLYFNVAPNIDSLAPVVAFIREDIIHFMETFEWK